GLIRQRDDAVRVVGVLPYQCSLDLLPHLVRQRRVQQARRCSGHQGAVAIPFHHPRRPLLLAPTNGFPALTACTCVLVVLAAIPRHDAPLALVVQPLVSIAGRRARMAGIAARLIAQAVSSSLCACVARIAVLAIALPIVALRGHLAVGTMLGGRRSVVG